MMFLYNIGIYVYKALVWLVSLFNPQVKLMRVGERNALDKISALRKDGDRFVWVHAASLGEFEQGRPLIERIKREFPEYKVLLTFFSPSGYEVRKNYAGADVIVYLPLDTPASARSFVDVVKPEKVFFVKYEFWLNYLSELRRRNVETYIISAIFRPDQAFFKWYGSIFREALKTFKTLYVQNDESVSLLASIGVVNVKKVGDTRFDRVADIAAAAKVLPVVKAFVGDSETLVVGSSWSPDEDLLVSYINGRTDGRKMIIAPHHVEEKRINELVSRLSCKYVLYTEADEQNVVGADCLIINTIGLLSSIYQYGQVAYVGGGFGVSIHNTLEAAVWGMPVVFGPKYHKFKEACELIDCGAARSVNNEAECHDAIDSFFADKSAAVAAKDYVEANTGATDVIFNEIFK